MTSQKSVRSKDSAKAMSIRTKIFGLMLAGAIVPLGLYAGISYQRTKVQIVEFADSNLSKDNLSNAKTVQSWIAGNDAAVRTAAQAQEMATMDPSIVREYMQKVNAELPVFYAVIAIGRDGQQIARSNIDKLISVADRPYFKRSLEGVPSTIQSAISKTTQRSFFTIAVPIRSQQKEVVGVLSALAESSQITDKITGSKIGVTGFSYLVASDGSILAHPNIAKIGTKIPDSMRAILSLDRLGRVSNLATAEGVDLKVTATQAGSDLILVSQIDEKEVEQPLLAAQRSLLIFLVGAVLLTVVLSYLLAESIASKINKLAKIADRISKARSELELSELEKNIDTVGGDREIKLLGAAFKRLSASIRLSMRNA